MPRKNSRRGSYTNSLPRHLLDLYRLLFRRYGPQHWWPGDSPFEVIVGAILTQSAAWSNVEKAIANLKQAGFLSPSALRQAPLNLLAGLIYSSGYYNAKAAKLKAFVEHLGAHYQDDLSKLFDQEVEPLREELLSIHGIGEETADSIILYAANKPIFVIDAYTRRIIDRLGGAPELRRYVDYQSLFHNNLPHDAQLFNEYHALFVRHAKEACRKAPLCGKCVLSPICPTGKRSLEASNSHR